MLFCQRRHFVVLSGLVASVLLYLGIRSSSPSMRLSLNGARIGAHVADHQDIYNATLGFERIFVINLPARTDHRDGMVLAAAASNLHFDFIDGITGEDVLEKVLPPPASRGNMKMGNIGSWRAHLNALRKIVEENISTALIMEDDADWDVRIREQLSHFARSAQALTQPLTFDTSKYADPTFPSPNGATEPPREMHRDALPSTVQPSFSPYGDRWDVLWLGHCGVNFPTTAPADAAERSKNLPKGRVVHLDDETVPLPKYLSLLAEYDDPLRLYPPHTRIVHHAMGTICSLAYAVTQASARRILHDMGLKTFDAPFDIMLRHHCEGVGPHRYHPCLTVQPQLFNHHRPAGKVSSYSDISDHGDGWREKPSTEFIRWSVRMNLERVFHGEEDYEDQFPDWR